LNTRSLARELFGNILTIAIFALYLQTISKMRYSTTSGMILAAMTVGEAVAGPTHAHKHRHLHKKE
jgi:hypothetical protein